MFPKYSLADIPYSDWDELLTDDASEVNAASATLFSCMPVIGFTESLTVRMVGFSGDAWPGSRCLFSV